MGIQILGIASGTDWDAVIEKVLAAREKSVDRLNEQRVKVVAKSDALTQLKSKLDALKSAADTLSVDSSFTPRSVSLRTPSNEQQIVTATANTGTLVGAYKVTISQVATQSKLTGASDVGSQLSETTDVSGITLSSMSVGVTVTEGSFSVNGYKVSIATSNSLQEVFNKVSLATSGAVTVAYDPTTDKITFSSASNIILGAASDDSNFLDAMRMTANNGLTLSSGSGLGVANIRASLSNANLQTPISGDGSFKVNGITFSYTMSDTIETLMNRINESDANATMYFDISQDRFRIVSDDSGNLNVSTEDVTGNFMAALGIDTGGSATLELGDNTLLNINGVSYESKSATVTSSTHGIEGLSITALTTGSETVTVTANTSSVMTKMQDFIDSYNDVQSFVSNNTRLNITKTKDQYGVESITTEKGAFYGNLEITQLAQQLRNTMFTSFEGLSGSLSGITSLGIESLDYSNGTLIIKDVEAFTDNLKEYSTTVANMFTNSTNGIAYTMDDLIFKILNGEGDGVNLGPFHALEDSFHDQIDDIDDDLRNLAEDILKEKNSLLETIYAYEKMQATINEQMKIIQSFF